MSMVWNGRLYVIPNVWMSEDNYTDLALSFYLFVSLRVFQCVEALAVQAGYLSCVASASTH